jgi:hypothetical protein
LLAGGLRLQASVPGVSENAKDAWLWSGTVPPHSSATVEVAYQVGSLKGIVYRITPQPGMPASQVRVAFQRRDLSSMRFESGDGPIHPGADSVQWERKDFLGPEFFSADIVETRNLFTALTQLAEIGPLITLLFFLTVVAALLSRQQLTAIQMFTISAGYAFYFPLIVYLSARFSFAVALAIAFAVPGVLLVNYARWLLGGQVGLILAAVVLALYQIFPTLAVFAGWNRGMVLLCLGVITLGVLINLQNRALAKRAVTAGLAGLLMSAAGAKAGQVQVVLPANLSTQLFEARPEKKELALFSYDPVQYRIRQEPSFFGIEAELGFRVLRVGPIPTPLFSAAAYVQEWRVESAETNLAQLVNLTNRLGLLAENIGSGKLRMTYRVPIETREGKRRSSIPMLSGTPGSARLQSTRNDLEVVSGSLWSRTATDKTFLYEIGVAGEDSLIIEWREQGGSPRMEDRVSAEGKQLYGIGLTRAQNLTIINSDASCTHFSEYEVPSYQKEEFRLLLPPGARLISASVNGAEITAPVIEERQCRIRLPERTPDQAGHRLSFRLAYPPVPLQFMGAVELGLPEVFQTAGNLEWVVALPEAFQVQVISSGLETQKGAPDLAIFGDYGRVLKNRPHTYLAKTLAPPGAIALNLKYRQLVPGMLEAGQEQRQQQPQESLTTSTR